MENQKGITAKVRAVTVAIRRYVSAARFNRPSEEDKANLVKAVGVLVGWKVQRVVDED